MDFVPNTIDVKKLKKFIEENDEPDMENARLGQASKKMQWLVYRENLLKIKQFMRLR